MHGIKEFNDMLFIKHAKKIKTNGNNHAQYGGVHTKGLLGIVARRFVVAIVCVMFLGVC